MRRKGPSKKRDLVKTISKWLRLDEVPPLVRRAISAVIGGTILLIGIAMIVLPGPAMVLIPLGLAVLATEFLWARRWLRKTRKLLEQTKATLADPLKK